jgi:hypothetical protein
MTQEQANNVIEVNKIALEKYKSVIVTSDNAIYLDSDVAPIAEHCKIHNKTYFVVKGEKELSAPVSEIKKKK